MDVISFKKNRGKLAKNKIIFEIFMRDSDTRLKTIDFWVLVEI